MTRLASRLAALHGALRARRAAWMALGAIAFGVMSIVGARNYIDARLAREKARLQPSHETVEVVVAKRDLKRGDTVGADTMAVRRLPRQYAPGGAVVPERFEAIAGARLLLPMRAGEPLLPTALAPSEPASISARVRPGIRAMTVAVDEVNSLSGLLQPGDRIDLLLSVRPPSAAGVVQPEVTRTVLQDVPVLATGRQSRVSAGEDAPAGRPFTAITVEVLPEQAQRLVVAQRSGKLTAVLRNPNDRRPVPERRLDLNMLLGLAPPAPAVAPVAPPRPVTEVIVGGRGQATPLPGTAAGGAASVPDAPVVPRPAQAPEPAPGAVAPPTGPRSAPLPAPIGPGNEPPAWLAPPAVVPLFR